MTEAENIYGDFKSLQVGSTPLELLVFYKAFPISFKAVAQAVTLQSVVFKVMPPGCICMEAGQPAWVITEEPLGTVKGRVVDINLHKGLAELDDFTYSDLQLGNRKLVRMQPAEPIPADLECKQHRFPVKVTDLSFNGAGVNLETRLESLPTGEACLLSFRLPLGAVRLPVKVMDIQPIETGQHISLLYSQRSPERTAIRHYLVERREELQEEIRQKYEEEFKKATRIH